MRERDAVAKNEEALSGYQIVTAETALVADALKIQSVTCPIGTKALGAGWAALDANNAMYDTFIASYFEPTYDGSSWSVRAQAATSPFVPWKLRLSVTCGSPSTLDDYEVHVAETPISTTTNQLQLIHACPAGKVSLGAGWSVLDSTSAYLEGAATFFSPTYDGTGWMVNAMKLSTYASSWKVRTRLVCINPSRLRGYQAILDETPVNRIGPKVRDTYCPLSYVATSAGWAALDSTSAINFGGIGYGGIPSPDGSSWTTHAGVSGGLWKLSVRAICIR